MHLRIAGVRIGDAVTILASTAPVHAEIRALDADGVIAVGDSLSVRVGDRAYCDQRAVTVPTGMALLGRVINANGEPRDGAGPIRGIRSRLHTEIPSTTERCTTGLVCRTGIRVIDAFLTIAQGARIGIFGSAGAGKSTLLEMLVQGVNADAVVVAAIGERGREAAEWARAVNERTTVIIETSDASAAQRLRAAHYAMAQADALRRRGLHVLLLLDSLARVGNAQRELGLAAGEQVGRGGYPASVVPTLARILEIGGSFGKGSISVIATVLWDGDDRDPLSEAARALLDGHIVLDTSLAQRGHFPAVDILASASRTMLGVVAPEHAQAAGQVRAALALIQKYADASALGIPIADPLVKRAQAAEAAIEAFVCQRNPGANWEQTLAELAALADTLE